MSEPKITKTKFRNGTPAFCVNFYWPDGKQYRKFFSDFAAAQADEARCKTELEKKRTKDDSIAIRQTWLTQAQLTTAEQAYIRLRDARGSQPSETVLLEGDLLSAIELFIKKRTEDSAIKAKPLGEAIIQFIADKLGNGRSDNTTDGLNNRLRRFASEMFGVEFGKDDKGQPIVTKGVKTLVSDVTIEHIKKFLSQFKDMGTKKTERSALSNFFNRCVESGYIAESPVAKTERVKVTKKPPGILSLAEVRKMLKFAQEWENGKTLGHFVLAVFCGLRPSEIERIDWSKIDLHNRQIDLQGDDTKPRQRRIVELEENAVEWLELCQITDKPLKATRRAMDALKIAGGYQGRAFKSKSKDKKDAEQLEASKALPAWPDDALRHTAVTYHYELHEHEGKTAKWAGNSPDVIHDHYRGRIIGDRKAAVSTFWGMRPSRYSVQWTDEDADEVP